MVIIGAVRHSLDFKTATGRGELAYCDFWSRDLSATCKGQGMSITAEAERLFCRAVQIQNNRYASSPFKTRRQALNYSSGFDGSTGLSRFIYCSPWAWFTLPNAIKQTRAELSYKIPASLSPRVVTGLLLQNQQTCQRRSTGSLKPRDRDSSKT